jgi:hypothetical protein
LKRYNRRAAVDCQYTGPLSLRQEHTI